MTDSLTDKPCESFEAGMARRLEERIAELPTDPAVLLRMLAGRHLLELSAWEACPEFVALQRALARPSQRSTGESPIPADVLNDASCLMLAEWMLKNLNLRGYEEDQVIFLSHYLKEHWRQAQAAARSACAPSPLATQDWIPVTERLPERGVYVLVFNGNWRGMGQHIPEEEMPEERWQDEHSEFIELMGEKITHWMPLPPAPGQAPSTPATQEPK